VVLQFHHLDMHLTGTIKSEKVSPIGTYQRSSSDKLVIIARSTDDIVSRYLTAAGDSETGEIWLGQQQTTKPRRSGGIDR
jgi:hypothetical protein